VLRPIFWVGLKTLIIRESKVIGQFWLTTLAPPVITAILYLAIFGDVLSEQIGSFNGISYREFLIPGLVALSAIPYAFSHTAAGLLGARLFRYLEELIVAPMPRWAIAAGYVFGGVMRGLLVGALVGVIAVLLCDFELRSTWLGLLSLLLIVSVSALGGLVAAMLAKTFDEISAFQTLILVPLAFLGGAFAPLGFLPGWAQALTLANPIYHMVNILRCGLFMASDVHVAVSISVVGLVGAALCVMALRMVPGRLAFD